MPKQTIASMLPDEHEIQAQFFRSAAFYAATTKDPRWHLLFAVPNGGHRHISVAKKLKAEGVKRGVPDVFLAVASAGCHGLFLEFKDATGSLRPEQKIWRSELTSQGYDWALVRTASEAIAVVEQYLKR